MNARFRTPSMAITPIWTTVSGEALVIRKDDNHGLGTDEPVAMFAPTPIRLAGGLQIEAATGGLLHSLVLTKCGRLFTWGQNGDGQLGRNGPEETPGEVKLPTTARVVQITSGAYYCAVLTEDGRVWTWGQNDSIQLGRSGNSQVPGKVDLEEKFVEVFCGFCQTTAVTEDKKVFGWGRNQNCELGPSRNEDTCTPARLHLEEIGPIKNFSVGGYHCMAITEGGDLYTWGFNGDFLSYGSLGIGHTKNERQPQLVLEEVVSAAGGDLHCIALKKDGELWGWGEGNFGQLGIPQHSICLRPEKIPKFWPDSERISGFGCGAHFSWAITNTGDLYTWGKGEGSPKETDRVLPEKRNFRVRLPHNLTWWEKIFCWFFLGISDSGSVFRDLPVEVTFQAVNAYKKYLSF